MRWGRRMATRQKAPGISSMCPGDFSKRKEAEELAAQEEITSPANKSGVWSAATERHRMFKHRPYHQLIAHFT